MIEMAPHTGCQCPACATAPDRPALHHPECPPCAEFQRQALAELFD